MSANASDLRNIIPGDPASSEDLLPSLYEELRRLAAHRIAQQAPGQTLQPTALVHEAWLKLSRNPGQRWKSRRHFFNAAAEAMRQILVDVARRKQAARHGGEHERIPLHGLEIALPTDQDRFLAVHDALDRLKSEDPAKAEVVTLKFFAGLETSEVAETLGISPRSVERQWAFAKAWLMREASVETF